MVKDCFRLLTRWVSGSYGLALFNESRLIIRTPWFTRESLRETALLLLNPVFISKSRRFFCMKWTTSNHSRFIHCRDIWILVCSRSVLALLSDRSWEYMMSECRELQVRRNWWSEKTKWVWAWTSNQIRSFSTKNTRSCSMNHVNHTFVAFE